MWIGIPYTKYSYTFTIPRMLIFYVLTCILYIVISLPETKHFVGSYIQLTKPDDVESNDRYYIVIVHGFVFGLLMYGLLQVYNPYPGLPKQIIPQKKIIPTI
tara:strand:+ start:248 stop:553 length:306 start_codon:yes stop_codon:yes gene_type:complete